MSSFSIESILSPIKIQSTPVKNDKSSDVLADIRHLINDVNQDSGFSSPTSALSCSPSRVYQQSQKSLAQESYSTPWTLFGSSTLVSETSFLASQERIVQATFNDAHLHAAFPQQMRDLREAYDTEVIRLVRELQYSMESVAFMPWLLQPIYCHYQVQHRDMITRIQCSLSLLQSTLLLVPSKKEFLTVSSAPNFATSTPKKQCHRPRRSRQPLSERSVRLMEKWYQDNQEHPYPSYEACEVMAEAGEVTVEQVKKWFANRRLRLRNTKSLHKIARRCKVSRSHGQH